MIDRLRRLYETTQHHWDHFSESQVGQKLLSGLRWLFVGGIVAYLAYELTTIGWGEVARALPVTPWFYVLLLLMYGTLPLTEAVLYGTAWGAQYRDLLPVLFRKRVLNNDVLGYSGEAYFYLWARRETNLGTGTVLRTVKDNVVSPRSRPPAWPSGCWPSSSSPARLSCSASTCRRRPTRSGPAWPC
jgi:hypothetical protein